MGLRDLESRQPLKKLREGWASATSIPEVFIVP
jgi:hypothetical protein